MSRDPLAIFWVHQIQIKRLIPSVYGDQFEDPETLMAFVDTPVRVNAGTRLVTNAQGQQMVCSLVVYAPATVADVPPGSVVSLPAAFGSRDATVIAFVRHQLDGVSGMPAHIEMDLQ